MEEEHSEEFEKQLEYLKGDISNKTTDEKTEEKGEGDKLEPNLLNIISNTNTNYTVNYLGNKRRHDIKTKDNNNAKKLKIYESGKIKEVDLKIAHSEQKINNISQNDNQNHDELFEKYLEIINIFVFTNIILLDRIILLLMSNGDDSHN